MKFRSAIILLIISLTGCQPSENDTSFPDNRLTAQEVLTLGNMEEPDEDTPLLSIISAATTDEDGFIYLADARTQKIHAFTPEGEHRWTQGGEGPGPGEFEMISALYALDDELFVMDGRKQLVTVYSVDGERKAETAINTDGTISNKMHINPDAQAVIPHFDRDNETMVSLYSPDFSEIRYQAINFDEIIHTDYPELEREVLHNNPGPAYLPDETTMVYAPFLYRGELLIYQKSNGQWHKQERISGYRDIEHTVKFHETSDSEHDRSHLSGFHPGGGGYFHTELQVISQGLFPQNDGTLAHLSSFLDEEEDHWQLVVEYVDLEAGTLQSSYLIDNLTLPQQLNKRPLWMDLDGRIFMSEDSETPLRVLRVE